MRRLVLLGAIVLVAAGCGHTKTAPITPATTATTTPAGNTASVFLMRDGKVAPVERQFTVVSRKAFLAAIAAGPTARERALGFRAPTTGEENVADEIYTLTQFTPGTPLTVPAGTFADSSFEDLTPAILVESPLPFQTVSSPLTVSGTANTFEATFEYELDDASGKVLSHGVVTATSGSGTRGTFTFTAQFSANGPAKLVVFERSAENGSRLHQVEIPLTLSS